MTEDAKRAKDESAAQKDRVEEQQNNQDKEVSDTDTASQTDEKTQAKATSDQAEDNNSTKTTVVPESEDEEATESEEKAERDGTADEKKDGESEAEPEENDTANEDGVAEDDNKVEKIEIEIEADDFKEPGSDFQSDVREQIENCKFEIVAALQESVHNELEEVTERQVRKIERRRRSGVIVRDIIILILSIIVGFFAYCLYDAQYFEFLRPKCEENSSCETESKNNSEPTEEAVKDTVWYQQNYGYLLDSLKLNLDADKISAYYLYTGDYKVDEIEPEYLLGMAYNKLDANVSYDSDSGIAVPAKDLQTAFVNLVGKADGFVKRNFTYHCANFTYDKANDKFTTPSLLCADTAKREIAEEVDEIYEEGSAIYFLTTAAIYDRKEESFYSFDDLFKPVVRNVARGDFAKHKSLFNQYQYQFKKVDGKYYFSGVMKLR